MLAQVVYTFILVLVGLYILGAQEKAAAATAAAVCATEAAAADAYWRSSLDAEEMLDDIEETNCTEWCDDCNTQAIVDESVSMYRADELELNDTACDEPLYEEWDFAFPGTNAVVVFTHGSLEDKSIRELKRIASSNRLPKYSCLTKEQLKERLYELRF